MPESPKNHEYENKSSENSDAPEPLKPGIESLRQGKYKYGVARTQEERLKDLALVGRMYELKEYATADSKGHSPFEAFILSPKTSVFTASLYNQPDVIFGTISVIPDSENLGMPMDKVFEQEVKDLRRAGYKIAEISQLAIDHKLLVEEGEDPESRHQKFLATLPLLKLAIQYGMYKNFDFLCIAVNPRPKKTLRFYKTMGFKERGQSAAERPYSMVNFQPAVGLFLDLKEISAAKNNDIPRILKETILDTSNNALFKQADEANEAAAAADLG